MLKKHRRAVGIFLAVVGVSVVGVSWAQQAETLTFRAQSRLVLLPFHVTHGKNYVTDLEPSDVELLEDGKRRDFTVFDSAATQGRIPLELVLLFDTSPAIDYLWDPVDVFPFFKQWNEDMARNILDQNGADVKISVYRSSLHTLYRLTPATSDPKQLHRAFQEMLTPEIPKTPETRVIPLSLPTERRRVDPGPFTEEYKTSPFISAEARGWTMEAAIGALNDVAASGDGVSRMLIMFSEGIGATTTLPEDIGNQALDLGIPIYPVATNYMHHIDSNYPRNLFRMHQFEALGKMTGGRAVEHARIDAETLRKILETVRNDGLSQYVVGFTPLLSTGTGKEHALEIRLKSKSSGALEGGKRRATY